jgi:2-phosphosulfolactate phosphatase
MQIHVALTPSDRDVGPLDGRAALVVDVLRATTTVVAACCAGCLQVIPVHDRDAALAAASSLPRDTLLAGERGGDPIEGFDLGNSPLEYTAERVAGRTIILTTSNGTTTMRSAASARAGATAALVNVSAAAGWALHHELDVTILCSGDGGALALEDTVCAGLLVERMLATAPRLELSAAAQVALRLAEYYGERLDDIRRHARWARRLYRQGRSADLDACLRVDTTSMVPVFRAGAIVPGSPALDVTAGRRAREVAP